MKTILHLNSSIFGDGGQSSRLDAERFGAFLSKPETRTPAQQAMLNESDARHRLRSLAQPERIAA